MKTSINSNKIRGAFIGLGALVLIATTHAATIDLGGTGAGATTSVGVDPPAYDEGLFQLEEPGPAFSGGVVDVTTSTTCDLSPTGGDLQFTTIGGVAYATFQLEMNEQGKKDGFTIDAFSVSLGGSTLWDMGGDTINVQPTSTISFESNGLVQIYIPASAFSSVDVLDTLKINVDLGETGAAVDSVGLAEGDGTTSPISTGGPIPEPSTTLLTLLGAAFLMLKRRQR